jgi:hypothetical protein
MVHGHLGVIANHIAAWTDASSGIGEGRKISLQERTYRFLIEATTEFKPWEKCHGVISYAILDGSAGTP